MTYIFDTNSFRVLGAYYPDRFPTFWKNFETAVDAGEVYSVREVYNELSYQARDWLLDWIETHKTFFRVPSPAETEFVAKIFRVPHFSTLVGEQQRLKGQPVADPFVIAAAAICEGTVVTEEKLKKNAAKIPNVCEHFEIAYTNVEGFLAAHSWKF